MRTLGIQGHLASGVERVHRTFLGLSQLQIFELLPVTASCLLPTHALTTRPSENEGENLSHHLDANSRLFLLLFAQLAADSSKGFS